MTVPPMLPIMDWVAMPSQRTRLEWISSAPCRGTNGKHGVIGLCVRHRLSSRTQNAQQRDAEQHHQGSQHHARGQGHIEAERADPAGALTVVLSQQAGNE